VNTGSTTLARDTSREELISIKEAARRLSMTPWSVYQLCDAGEIASGHVDGRRLVRAADVSAYAARVVGAPDVWAEDRAAFSALAMPEVEGAARLLGVSPFALAAAVSNFAGGTDAGQ